MSEPRRFIGRRQVVDQIYSRLRNPEFESSSLVGERRMGKTSLFNYISHPDVVSRSGLDPATYLFVYLDLQMVEPHTTPTRMYQHALRRISNRIDDLEAKTQLTEVSGYDNIDTYDLSDVFDVIDQKGIHIALLMDEFENIAGNANFAPEFYYGLRSLAIHHNLALVTSSQNDLVELSRSETVRSSPFFNIFATINLQPFAAADVQALLQAYLDGSEISFSESEVLYLWRVSGGNPFLLQMAAFKLFDTYVQGHQESHRLPMMHTDFGYEARPHLQVYWEYTSDDEKIVLALLALLETQKDPQATTWSIPQLEEWYRRASNVVPSLTRRGLLRRVQDGYRLFSSTFVDVVLEEITDVASEPRNTEEWQQRAGPLLGALPDLLRRRVELWLTSTNTRNLDMFLRWLADPRTAEAALEVITNSEAPFEQWSVAPVQQAQQAQEEATGESVPSLAALSSSNTPGTGAQGAAEVEEVQVDEGGGSDIELLITPPPPGHMLLSLCQWLERVPKKRAVPLVQMLSSLEEVESITEAPAEEEEGRGPRFIKRRRDTRGQTPGALQQHHVVLNPTPPPGEPLAEGEEEALLAAVEPAAEGAEGEGEEEALQVLVDQASQESEI